MELDDLGDDWAFAGINGGEMVEEDFLRLEKGLMSIRQTILRRQKSLHYQARS